MLEMTVKKVEDILKHRSQGSKALGQLLCMLNNMFGTLKTVYHDMIGQMNLDFKDIPRHYHRNLYGFLAKKNRKKP